MTNDLRAWLGHELKGLVLIAALGLLLAICVNAFRKDRIPWVDHRRMIRAGDVLPYIPIYPTMDTPQRRYLGLPPGQQVVPITDSQAELLIMEELQGRIKIVGLAVGNTPEEAEDFRKEYGLKFPVIADVDGLFPLLLGPDLAPPFSLYVHRDASGKLGRVVATHEGVVEDPQILFDGLIELLTAEPDSTRIGKLFRRS